ncbi:MAG: DUF2147 domain-containing protein [Legionella sp.]|nr:MAG: DUF2147 domain-containing protein [Legionella sp.]
MKLWKALCGFALTVCYLPALLAAQSPAGTWTTIDDKTGAKRAVVKLSVAGGTLNGSIIKVFPQPGDTGICSKCPGAFKDKKIQGLGFIWGLKDQGNGVWSGGSILDPKTGKIYKAKVTIDGNKLYVRGYIGVSALGRTQTWIR